jgi:hypothetical protein
MSTRPSKSVDAVRVCIHHVPLTTGVIKSIPGSGTTITSLVARHQSTCLLACTRAGAAHRSPGFTATGRLQYMYVCYVNVPLEIRVSNCSVATESIKLYLCILLLERKASNKDENYRYSVEYSNGR